MKTDDIVYAVDSDIHHHTHVIFQIMLYRNINVWVLVLTLILFNKTEASKSERKITPADAPTLSTSIPTTVNAGAEKDVSIKSQISEEVDEWPIREMIAILGSGSAIQLGRNYFKAFVKTIVSLDPW